MHPKPSIFTPSKLILTLALSLYFAMPYCLTGQQRIGFYMSEGVNRVDIEFEKFSNLIVVPVVVNDFITMKFILDTGAESIILTEKLFADLLDLNLVRSMTIDGPGIIDTIKTYVASNVNMSIGSNIHGVGLNMLVLQEDYLELNKNLGEEVYGIIGWDIFSRFVIEVDYDNHKLVFHRPETFKPKKYLTEIPMDVVTKPYVSALVRQKSKQDTIRFMVDTGASHAALLDVNATDHLVMPEKLLPTRLGQGLGGEIPGYIGRIDECRIDGFSFDDVLISVPKENAYSNVIKRGSRHGTIGGDMLSHFRVTFDYYHEKMYLAKSGLYKNKFDYDMSGMTLIAEGEDLDSLIVADIREGGPAHKAGIREGDYIRKINGMTLHTVHLSDINAILRKKDGMRLKVTIVRGDEKIKKTFRLERMI